MLAVTQTHSSIRVVELSLYQFLCISSFQGSSSASVKENVSNGKEMHLLF